MRQLTIAALLLTAPVAASAQFKLPSGLGGAVPGLGTAGAGNAAGLLGYCLKNKLLGATGASPVTGGTTGGTTGATGAAGLLGKLTARPEVTQSPGFALGQQGQVQQPGGGVLPLGTLTGKLKTQACDLVLKRAGSFL